MKERVLFVDDEQNILNGLRRMLRSKRTNWELHFANSGPEALKLMKQHEVDIVVSDMKMPGMDGAELLHQISQTFPNTIRIILSGYADKEAILRTIGPAHQYLSKPCERDLLLGTVNRSLELRKILNSESLRTLVNGLDSLPTPSEVFNKLVQKLAENPISPGTIASIIESDISLAANFLKLTNSAYFGFSQNRPTVSEAINRLGIDTIKAIVMVAETFHPFEGSTEELLEIKTLGQQSIDTGHLARKIAQELQLEHRLVDQAYIAGTLSLVGAHLMLVKRTKTYRELKELVRRQGASQSEVARKVLGATFGEVGGYLLGIWGFTDPIIEAVLFQNEPSSCSNKTVSPLTCVHIAQSFNTHSPENLDQPYIDKLGLTNRIQEIAEIIFGKNKPSTQAVS